MNEKENWTCVFTPETNWMQVMEERHSVRSYTSKEIAPDIVEKLEAEIARINAASGLYIQLVSKDPDAFKGFLPHYGSFKGVHSYIALVGKDTESFDETSGYFGQALVLYAQSLSLNTCWVALTFSKKAVKKRVQIPQGYKLGCVIAIGYGTTPGKAHKSKSPLKISNLSDNDPAWFVRGVQAALLAPTAVNQQKFYLERQQDTVYARATGGMYSKVDLGIVKFQFWLAAGTGSFSWKQP